MNEPNNQLQKIEPQASAELERVSIEQAIGPKSQTPAQAKIDAIASLTMSAYAKAATLDLTEQEIAALSADFPDDAFKPGAGGKEHLIYIEHAYLRERLNQVFRPGQWAIVPRNRWAEPFRSPRGTEGSRVYVEAMLVIRGAFVSESIGEMEYYPSNAAQNYGDAVEGAKTAALRRCCKELGVGLQAWKKDFCDGWMARKRFKGPSPRASDDNRTIPSDRTPQNMMSRPDSARPAPQSGSNPPPTDGEEIEWREVAISFGQKKGTLLGDLSDKDLQWWCESWVPKPFKGAIDPEALALRKALDMAAVEMGFSTPPQN